MSMDNDRETRETRAPRRSGPRFGSFITIAAALLLLFGAASRMGKIPETAALFGIDQTTEQRIGQEITRLKAALTLGATPAGPSGEIRSGGALPIDQDVLPPHRQEVDIDLLRQSRNQLSAAVRDDGDDIYDQRQDQVPGQVQAPIPNDNRPEASRPEQPAPEESRRPSEYVVVQGDTWNKIAAKTLGDGKRWQELLKANPAAQKGLQVGMRLAVPR